MSIICCASAGVREAFDADLLAPMPSPGSRMGERAAKVVKQELSRRGVGQQWGPGSSGSMKRASPSRRIGLRSLIADLVVFRSPGLRRTLSPGEVPICLRNEAGFVRR